MSVQPAESEHVLTVHTSDEKQEDLQEKHDLPVVEMQELTQAEKEISVRYRAAWPDAPAVRIEYRDIAYQIPVPLKETGIPNLFTALRDFVSLPVRLFRPKKTRTVKALATTSGVIEPGTMTLILAPPGHGKSSLLKALAGRLEGDTQFSGTVRYNGVTQKEALEQGIHTERMAVFVDQIDVHLALLTVKETFQFAVQNCVADPELLEEKYQVSHEQRVETMIEMLGLGECQNVIVGNDLTRGISGGQKKRVTLGEMIIGNARVLCLDEISTGLDAAATYDIVRSLRRWATETKGSIVMSLLQPAPEVVAQFDSLVLMRDGHVIYQGPRSDAMAYLEAINIRCPSDQDVADFFVSFLSDPEGAHQRQLKREARQARKQKWSQDEIKRRLEPPKIPLSTPSLEKHYLESPQHQEIKQKLGNSPAHQQSLDKQQMSDYSRAHYTRPFPHSVWTHTKYNLQRQTKYIGRNLSFIMPRIFQAIFLGIVIGTLYIDLNMTEFSSRLGLILYAATSMGFGNFSEIPVALESKLVVYKQVRARFYPAISYVLSTVVVHLPIAALESLIFCTLVYWISAFTDDAGRFFFFVLIALCCNLAISVMYRCIVYVAPNQDVAETSAGPMTAIFLLFGGFLVTYNKIRGFLVWVYWLSPFSWTLRSLAQNEFFAPRYDNLINYEGVFQRAGDVYLRVWEISRDGSFKWAAVGMLLGYFFLFQFLAAYIIQNQRYLFVMGTKRIGDDDEDALKDPNPALEVANDANKNIKPPMDDRFSDRPSEMARQPSLRSSTMPSTQIGTGFALPFTPIQFAWRNLKYTIFEGKEKKPKVLLSGINGFAKPGTLTALMGSSGAGKTTLMDVLAGRKTVGLIEGDILVNGFPKKDGAFNRMMGYVEQNDLHLGTQTVREALQFSARLRLSDTITPQQRDGWVEEVLKLLELSDISDRLIGDAVIAGLSPGQLKRVTIGVELVANPTILFLDEPTSGLDSRAALQVMRVVRRIASTGRSVVCTIHQPSSELFYMFDRLLLLRSGGRTVYFGDVGDQGADLIDYFESCNGDHSPKIPQGTNPASWMLDVIGAGTGGQKFAIDFHDLYMQSEVHKKNVLDVEVASTPKADDVPIEAEGRFAQSAGVQFSALMTRITRSYWRNTAYNFTRFIILTFLGILFGLVWLQVDDTDQAGVNSKIAVFFMTAGFAGVINCSTAMPLNIRNRASFYREQASNMYHPVLYAVTNTVIELPVVFILSLCYIIPLYFLVGFSSNGSAFFKYLAAHYLLSLNFLSLGQLLAASLPNAIVAQILQGLWFNFIFLFGGTFIQAGNIPAGWKWFYYINPLPKAVIALSETQFDCSGSSCPSITVLTPSGVSASIPTSLYVELYNDIYFSVYGNMMGWLVLTLCVLQSFVFICTRFVRHVKR